MFNIVYKSSFDKFLKFNILDKVETSNQIKYLDPYSNKVVAECNKGTKFCNATYYINTDIYNNCKDYLNI